MPRRELLTPAQREQLLAFPTDEAELIRLYSLSEIDQALLNAHRGIHNRLGVAVQMAYLRFPGRPIARDEAPYATLLAMVAAQIKAPVSAWSLYAERDQTRRMHAIDIIRWLGLTQLDASAHRSLAQWLLPIAMQSTQGPVLVQALIIEMRRRGIVLPPITTLERLCAEVHTRAQRRIFKLLTEPLHDTHCTELDALLDTHVLDGLLYHESDLRIEEHYTDTAGFTDHVFGLCPVVGFTFAPRIADLKDKRIFVPGKAEDWPALTSLIGGSLNNKSIEQVFDDVRRLGASIKQGTVTSSLMLRKLSAYPRQNSIAIGLREMGRIERSLHTLKWLREPEYRRRVGAGLNKGESRHKLARAVFFHRLGEIRDRAFEDQQNRASGLNLVMQAITIWNTVYLDLAIEALRQHQSVDDSLLSHISPLGWHHINLTGDYSWAQDKRPPPGEFRALRPAPQKSAPKDASPGQG